MHGGVGALGDGVAASVAETPEGVWACAGEALERRALAGELRARGVVPEADDPASVPDTATILAGVSAGRGPLAGAARLHGEVAWAALDAGGVLRAGTDAGGSRALYAGCTLDGGCVVASAPSEVLAGGVPGEVDADALAAWVEEGRFAGGRTPWRHVRRFRAGQSLAVRAGEAPIWSEVAQVRNPGDAGGSTERWARSLGYAIALAVRRRAAPEGAVAVALGAGAASEVVLRLAAERRAGALVALVLDTGAVDLARVTALAAAVGARLVRVPADAGALEDAARDALVTLDVPTGPVEAASWLLARAASQAGASVLLTGMGATAALGGDAGLVGEGARAIAREVPSRVAGWLGGRVGRAYAAAPRLETGGPDASAAPRATFVGGERAPEGGPVAGLRGGEAVHDDRGERHVLRGALRGPRRSPPSGDREGVEPPAPRVAESSDPSGASSLGAVLEARQLLLADTWLPALDLACRALGVEVRHPFREASLIALAATVPAWHLLPRPGRSRGLLGLALDVALTPVGARAPVPRDWAPHAPLVLPVADPLAVRAAAAAAWRARRG